MSLPIARDSLLYLDNVHCAFDGFKAINGLSFVMGQRELRAVIGPNGAGKTTMMDIITGKTRPDRGDVLFLGGRVDLTRLDEADIANRGIGRKFQRPTVFERHSVAANVALAGKSPRGALATLFHRDDPARRRRCDDILDTVRLTSQRDSLAGALSHGQKQWLEIGMLLAQEPLLLLVDEPAAGMTDAETLQTAALLKEIAKEQSVIVVEHDMSFVRELGAKVTCLHEGAVLAEGTLDAVSANPKVIDVYLGR
jgi:urea transport system ATP-binding protein